MLRLFSIALLAGLLLSSISAGGSSQAVAQQPTPAPPPEAQVAPSPNRPPASQGQAEGGPEVIWAIGPSLSEPLRSMAPSAPELPAGGIEINPLDPLPLPKTANQANTSTVEAFEVQSAPGGMSIPAAMANFDGLSNADNSPLEVYPPDTEGDIGYDPATHKKYYMQWVNLSYQIWDVTNPAAPMSLVGPTAGTTMWSGTGTLCATQNGGDPIVLFDHLANRWFASQLAYDLISPFEFDQCVAVSKTADPTGSWYLYTFTWDSGNSALFNDYPKFAVWPDGYYLSVNQYGYPGETWQGPGVAVLDRTAMLSGESASMQRFDIPPVTGFGSLLPSELDGPAPAAGTPNYFLEWDDAAWLGDAADTLRIWEFHVDWTTPSNSTFGLVSFDPNQLIATNNVDPNLCNYGLCIQQPATTQRLHGIADRLMHRMQYRDFGSYQTLVGNHSVDANGADRAGIHWFELRDSGAGWGMQQQGVYSPDANSRWMGSIAMDRNGAMALGYSVSSTTVSPSVRYTGRLASDTLGTLPQGEASLVAGSGSQTGTAGRWGDYSMMGLDPRDDCTFWYTQEYYAVTSERGWRTRIGSFAFPACVAAATPKIIRVYPPNGSIACRRPQVGVVLSLRDVARKADGSFDPSTVTLKLDGTTVTNLAQITQSLSAPASVATILYTPPSNLTTTPAHQGSFIYPSPGGPLTYNWTFTAANTTCPTSAQQQAPESTSLEALAATATEPVTVSPAAAPGGTGLQTPFQRLRLRR
jgi:hypothetical protein